MTASSSCRQSSASANQSSVRRHNQRLILSAIRRAGTLTKADLAASTGLTAQSVTVIVRELEGAGLLVRGAAHKGRIGQPSIPLAINPEGAFSVGLKIGRRRSALALVDFGGRIHKSAELYHRLPTPQGIFDFVASQWSNMLAPLSSEQGVDLLGLGVAMPFELWQWAEQMGAHAEQVMAWKQVDIARELTTLTGCEVSVENDATSACAAEFAFASTPRTASFGYLYIGYFIGGGIVLNGTVFAGLAGNAGAFGSMPVRA
ncbi:MAG: ROK family transcriptional regulator, partial [Pseudomonadales bacterium]